MTRFGAVAWSARRGGRLSAIERAGLVAALIGRRLRLRLARRDVSAPRLADVAIALPDSAVTRAALKHCVSECTPSIVNHSLRCYAWGALLAAQQAWAFDHEAFAVAALLHDIELGRTERRAHYSCTCFACAGAEGARAFLNTQQITAAQVELICDAIALHLNAHVPLDAGVEAHLLNASAALDVVGAALSTLHPDDRKRVLAAYPRLAFKHDIRAAMRREQSATPETRAALLMRLGFAALTKSAPFDG